MLFDRVRRTLTNMTESSADVPEPDVMEIYEDASPDSLACRVCGVLVARRAGYPKVHWDWHEASNGA
jgi:hypothetical protein